MRVVELLKDSEEILSLPESTPVPEAVPSVPEDPATIQRRQAAMAFLHTVRNWLSKMGGKTLSPEAKTFARRMETMVQEIGYGNQDVMDILNYMSDMFTFIADEGKGVVEAPKLRRMHRKPRRKPRGLVAPTKSLG
jgi:hypothetical protein